MATNTGIGVNTAKGGGISWSSYWTQQSEVLFFGEISKITGGRLYNQKTGATDYLTVGGSAGSYTFQCPNTAPYVAADTDYIWFNMAAAQRTPTEAELIGYDFTRTIVKYEDASDYSIQAIMILSSDYDSDRMRDDFHLSVWWDGILNAHGNLKGNRSAAKNTWVPESSLLTGLLAYYKLENVNNEIAGNNLNNNNTVTFSSGKVGNCADLGSSNTNKSLTIDNGFGLTYQSSRSIMGWVNMNTAPGASATVALITLQFGTNPGNYSGLFYRNLGGLKISANTGVDYIQNLNIGSWYHLAITWNQAGNQVKVYINGELRITDVAFTSNYAAQTTRFSIGNFQNTLFSSAKIDEVGLWSKILTAAEVLEHYNSGNGKTYPF